MQTREIMIDLRYILKEKKVCGNRRPWLRLPQTYGNGLKALRIADNECGLFYDSAGCKNVRSISNILLEGDAGFEDCNLFGAGFFVVEEFAVGHCHNFTEQGFTGFFSGGILDDDAGIEVNPVVFEFGEL